MSSPEISPAKLAANQANAQYSTGPRTDEGKARISKNAVKTGLCSSDVLLPGESLEEFEAMRISFLQQINPLVEGLERAFFDELTAAAWKLRRIQRFETDLQSQSGDLLAQLDDDKLQKKLDNLARHKARIERTLHRSLQELKALQTDRALAIVLSGPASTELPGLADWKAITKQTQHKALLDRQKQEEAARARATRAKFRAEAEAQAA